MYATLDFLDMADSDDIEIDGQPLRCIIARRFSNTVRVRCGYATLFFLDCFLYYASYIVRAASHPYFCSYRYTY